MTKTKKKNLHDKLARIGACEGGALLVPIEGEIRQLVPI
jgi:hypothetical protein